MGVVSRWQEYARQYGWVGLARHLALRVVRPVWESSGTQLLVIPPPAPPITARVAVRIALLTPQEAARHGLLNAEWEQRWHRGDVCFAAWRDGRFIHHSWVSYQDSYIGEVYGWLRLKAGEAYVYDCFTDGSCRGQGVFPAVLSHIGHELFNKGTHRIWIAVEEENRSSLKAIQRAGFRPAGEVFYRRVGRRANRAMHAVPGAPPFRVE